MPTRFALGFALSVSPSSVVAQQSPPAPSPAPAVPDSPPSHRVQQMRTDLNQMESLMNHMQSEINFLRDQNLQILLNTNVRMWTILIRDLRSQLEGEERREINQPPIKPNSP